MSELERIDYIGEIRIGLTQDQSNPLLISPPADNQWLRKTDWCCDGIIANED
jgi:hypothetical protein